MLAADIDRVLSALGDQLDAEADVSLVLVGGAALALLGVVERATYDVDVIARAGAGGDLEPPEPFSRQLKEAARKVARDLQLSPEWLNGVVGGQWHTGLPPGFAGRIQWRSYGRLRIGVAGRLDLIALKLYAVADDVGPESRHFQDLLALGPSDEDLRFAEAWVRQQDPSTPFQRTLERVVDHVRNRAR